jgi:hypothetical protein
MTLSPDSIPKYIRMGAAQSLKLPSKSMLFRVGGYLDNIPLAAR